ncbi:MAG: hypothetical protein H8E87_01485 [FCB group bacterium]|nr:hypothetical protein [FCB group bacterium]
MKISFYQRFKKQTLMRFQRKTKHENILQGEYMGSPLQLVVYLQVQTNVSDLRSANRFLRNRENTGRSHPPAACKTCQNKERSILAG